MSKYCCCDGGLKVTKTKNERLMELEESKKEGKRVREKEGERERETLSDFRVPGNYF